jgi:Na+-driven multidrug efflux pump
MHFVGDYWLIYGGLGVPPLGFDGIVITTIVTMIAGSFFMGYALWEAKLLKCVSYRDFIPDKDSFKELANQGFPACMNMISVAFGLLLIMGFILYFGESAAAAYGVGIRIQQLFLLPTLGISIGMLAIIAQNNGAGRIDRVQETLRESFYFGLVVLSLGFALMMGAPEFLYRLFTSDEEVIAIGTTFLRISSITGFAFMTITFYTAALQGMKYPFSAFSIGFGRQVILPLIVLPVLFTWFHITLVSIWIMILGVNAAFAWIAYLLTKRALKKRKHELGS